MDAPQPGTSNTSPGSPSSSPVARGRVTRARKRKRISSESSSDTDPVLPENLLEVEKNLHASAMKNNLDDVSVKKILKSVVTNDHVLALVKLQEEESNMDAQPDHPRPKITRSKAKELKKVSPQSAWNLDNMSLSPIKHIPVKTRPEVTALIAQELPDDEDDEEYEPTHDDVPSDDDHTLESCSDVDSQPRTPATPRGAASPRVIKDGPFKVPQDVSTPRRKLDMDEDATIALRTRSKLSLSSIPIDHIESSFVPPDEPPMPATDDVWTDFLQICLNPDTEDADDDDDPEYDVAADQDAHDEEEEGLENIMKISKKELNDLVTELFSIMPEGLGDDELGGKLASDARSQNTQEVQQQSTSWEGKQEPVSDDDTPLVSTARVPTPFVETREERLSIRKSEPNSDTECQEESEKENRWHNVRRRTARKEVTLAVVESEVSARPAPAGAPAPPPAIKNLLAAKQTLTVQVEPGVKMLPGQIEILQQQLRQHIQLATSNFLQLFVHPVHWSYARHYKGYLETLRKMALDNPKSVVNVCNLKPAWDLMKGWETTVAADTEENKKMVEFVQREVERSIRRGACNNFYVGNFHPMFLDVVSSSPVFLYPHLLPPLPYRSDDRKKFGFTNPEDELIACGLDEFWDYVENNPELFKQRGPSRASRWGLLATVDLLCKHMFPWMQQKAMLGHINHARKHPKLNEQNPINRFFDNREVTPVKHVLLPFNPSLTLYEHPVEEMPKIWIKYLAKKSQRFQEFLYRRNTSFYRVGQQPTGVPVELGSAVKPALKKPLPAFFTGDTEDTEERDAIEINVQVNPVTTAQSVMYSVIQTSNGAYLVPLNVVNTVNSTTTPIVSSEVNKTAPEQSVTTVSITVPMNNYIQMVEPVLRNIGDHCPCCVRLRKISKRQRLITEYFKTPKEKTCPCKEKRKVVYPRVTRKLRLLVNTYKSHSSVAWYGLFSQMKSLSKEIKNGIKRPTMASIKYSLEEIVAVTSFQLKLTVRTAVAKKLMLKRSLRRLIVKFNPDTDDIYKFYRELEKQLNNDVVDVFHEFLGYLTMEQADKIGKYTDYFRVEHLVDFMKKVEELVPNKEHKHNILSSAYTTLTDAKLASCETCSKILEACTEYPELANYVFSLFPHPKQPGTENNEKIPLPKYQLNKAPTIVCAPANNTPIVIGTVGANPPPTINVEEHNRNAQARDNVEAHSKNGKAKDNKETENAKNNVKGQIETAKGRENVEPYSKNAKSIDNVEAHSKNAKATEIIEENDEDTRDADNSDDELPLAMLKPQAVENIEEHSKNDPSKDSVADRNDDTQVTNATDVTEPPTTDNTEDVSMYDDSQTRDYEADQSDSDDDGNQTLTIIEDPVEINETQSVDIKKETQVTETVLDTGGLTVTKTEVDDITESDMSTMMMSEDDTSSIVKVEPPAWKRDEDKLLLQVLQQSLTPEEMKDKTILEIIEQKKVLQLAAQNLPEKSLDDVRERILYLLEFLVASDCELISNKQ